MLHRRLRLAIEEWTLLGTVRKLRRLAPSLKFVLIRQKVVLSLLTQASMPLSRIAFVKLVFLLRQETGLQTILRFYDFVPYEFGPFSFTLYRDLESLRQNGYVTVEEPRIALCERTLDQTRTKTAELPESILSTCDKTLVFDRGALFDEFAVP